MPLLLSNKEITQRISFKEQIRRLIQNGQSDSFILIVPTNRLIRKLKREFLNFTEKKISPAFNIYTLELLFKKIYLSYGENKYYIEGELQSVFFEEAIKILVKERKLVFFKLRPDGKMPRGTFEQICKIISEFKEKMIFPENLEKDQGAINEYEIPKVQDLIEIYKQYICLLGDKFIDKGGIYLEILNKFKEPFHNDTFSSIFRKVENIFILGFSEFSTPEVTLINTLFGLENVNVSLRFDYFSENQTLFGHLEDNINLFSKYIKSEEIITEEESFEFKRHIQKTLFNPLFNGKKVDFSEKVYIFPAKDRLQEVNTICKLIKDIVSNYPDIDISSICIATYSTEKYTNLFREAFKKFQIPANITDRFKLASSPVISSLIAFLEIPKNNFRRKDIFRALLSPYLKFIKPDGTKIDAFNLFNISNNLKIKYGDEVWLHKIERKLAFLHEQLLAGEEEDEIKIRHEIKKLELAKQDFIFLKSLFAPFSQKMNPENFKNEILGIIHKLRVQENILDIDFGIIEKEDIEKDARAISKFISILSELKNIYEFNESPEAEYTFLTYLEDFKIMVSHSLYNIRQQYGNGVFITAAEETRGLNFEIMFLAGLVEGDFPITFKAEIFKPEIRRKTEEQHLLENRYLFYQTISNFNKFLFLSFPQYENDNETIPSTFIGALKEVIQFKDSVISILNNNIYSDLDLQFYIGNNFSDVTGKDMPPDIQTFGKGISDYVKIEESRTKNHTLLEYEGFLYNQLNENEKASLEKLRTKEFSISELEEYGKCPMKYFFNRILNLELIEEEEDDISAMELGSILHDILFEFYHSAKKNENGIEFPLSKPKLDKEIERLKTLAVNKIDELNITNPFFKIDFEKVIGDGIRRKGILQNFLEFENSEDKAHKLMERYFQPKYFEVSFGKIYSPKKSVDSELTITNCIDLNGIKMRGKIDRIDILEENNAFLFLIYDYKTGKTPDNQELIDGTSLQLPIYIIAVEKLLSDIARHDFKSAGGVYYILQSKIDLKPGLVLDDYMKSRSGGIKDSESFTSILKKSSEFVKKYVDELSKGNFKLPLESKNLDKICKFCDFKTICRIKTVKIIEKDE